jgi:SpoVK/Ycf46/Vps4 family AAA+-type ATPase
MEPYRHSVEHICDEMKRIDLLVRRALTICRGRQSHEEAHAFPGLLITEAEIDRLLEEGEFLTQHWRKQDAAKDALAPLDRKLAELRQAIDQRKEETAKAGRSLTLPTLADRFGLSAAETDLLLIAMAPELEPRYETLYAYLQDDATRRRPSVDLALNLISRRSREKLAGRHFFSPGAPLLHFRMIELVEDAHDRNPSLLRRFMKIDDSLLRHLLEHPPSSLALGAFVTPRVAIDALEFDEPVRLRLRNLVDALGRGSLSNSIVRLISSSRPDLDVAAEAIAGGLYRSLVQVDVSSIESNAAALDALCRDAALLEASVAAWSAGPSAGEKLLIDSIGKFPGPVFALGPATAFATLPATAAIWRIEIPHPEVEIRQQAWESALAGASTDADTARLADSFLFSASEIRQAAGLAFTLAALKNPSNPSPSMSDILEAGRSLSSPALNRFAVPIEPRYEWEDIILPAEKKQQLEHVAARYRHRRTVHRDWGFGAKLSRGKGLNVMFTGPPGVGKTMAAEVLAKALSLILFQIDLSAVVSKYIGETEQHLAEIFREAEKHPCLLFFDEADALFGKRTEVQNSNDRYANFEVNYLLQRIEQYEGIVVLATNMQSNLDEAFVRRIQESIDFPFPDEASRAKIWQRHRPDGAPVEDDVDFAFLARQFKLSGGSIKNAMLSAAFLAANAQKKIGMTELIRGVKMELRKEGKLIMKTDFGKYFDLAQSSDSPGAKPV